MTGRLSRIVKRTGPNWLFARGSKPRIIPMTREDERIQAELNRRREERRERETKP